MQVLEEYLVWFILFYFFLSFFFLVWFNLADLFRSMRGLAYEYLNCQDFPPIHSYVEGAICKKTKLAVLAAFYTMSQEKMPS